MVQTSKFKTERIEWPVTNIHKCRAVYSVTSCFHAFLLGTGFVLYGNILYGNRHVQSVENAPEMWDLLQVVRVKLGGDQWIPIHLVTSIYEKTNLRWFGPGFGTPVRSWIGRKPHNLVPVWSRHCISSDIKGNCDFLEQNVTSLLTQVHKNISVRTLSHY